MNGLLTFAIGAVLARAFIDLLADHSFVWFGWGLLVAGALIARLTFAR